MKHAPEPCTLNQYDDPSTWEVLTLYPRSPNPIAMKNHQWVKEEIEELLAAKVIHSS